jgi:hypothetical protein
MYATRALVALLVLVKGQAVRRNEEPVGEVDPGEIVTL